MRPSPAALRLGSHTWHWVSQNGKLLPGQSCLTINSRPVATYDDKGILGSSSFR
jgi:hypothetical protein